LKEIDEGIEIMRKTIDDLNLLNPNENEIERNERFRKQFGNCFKLAEILKKQGLQLNPFISPLLCEDYIFERMPKTYLIVR
jgi:hypothetical protein